ncbi:uncharacterized protein LOC134211395 isoform X2 [Armigeres subalbatus]|uniref:uncharacterized protein LOC134211395 isoform X2 n=1 Tax=Armigeres subalbatus TaxID=124917 RepID=UPI002ED11938
MEPSYSSGQGGAPETSSSSSTSSVPYQIHNLETVAEENEECADSSTLPRRAPSPDTSSATVLVLGMSQATQTPADDCYQPMQHQGRSIYEGIINPGDTAVDGSPVSTRDADGGEISSILIHDVLNGTKVPQSHLPNNPVM